MVITCSQYILVLIIVRKVLDPNNIIEMRSIFRTRT